MNEKGERIAVWADAELLKRINALLEAVEQSNAADFGITKSAVIKAAIRRGLPSLEAEWCDHG